MHIQLLTELCAHIFEDPEKQRGGEKALASIKMQ